jgi:hypothetical protein
VGDDGVHPPEQRVSAPRHSVRTCRMWAKWTIASEIAKVADESRPVEISSMKNTWTGLRAAQKQKTGVEDKGKARAPHPYRIQALATFLRRRLPSAKEAHLVQRHVCMLLRGPCDPRVSCMPQLHAPQAAAVRSGSSTRKAHSPNHHLARGRALALAAADTTEHGIAHHRASAVGQTQQLQATGTSSQIIVA